MPEGFGPPQAWQARPYQQLLRGPTLRWWRPLLSLLVGIAAALLAVLLLLGVGAAVMVLTGTDVTQDSASDTPAGFGYLNLMLAALVPVVMLAVWGGYGWRPRWVASVQGGVRRAWLARCWLIALVVLGSSSLVLELADGWTWTPEHDWPALFVVVLVTTPLQAAGEEYLFRGWIPLLVGSVSRNGRAGAVVGGAVSSGLFALAHGAQDVWLFSDRFCFGALACWLAWRTGGLEAGMALHGANNVVALILTIGAGELSDTLTASTGSPEFLVTDVLTLLVTVALITWWARRRHVVRLFSPPVGSFPVRGPGGWDG